MKDLLLGFLRFTMGSALVVARGSKRYYAWIAFLLLVIGIGVTAYSNQLSHGLITSNMRDQVSWGFYIGNFAFMVGVAAAAVVLVIPAYVYNWGPIKDVVLLGELLAVAAVVMCILFVTVDVGRPQMIWHMMPGIGTPNFPYSMLIWDVLVLNLYLVVNLVVVTYLVYKGYEGEKYNSSFVLPIVFLSIPLAICIHTVTAFLFVGLPARPFWNTAILAPRFIASAFCSGPSLLLLIFLLLRRLQQFSISNKAVFKIGELLAYAMAVNLFLLGAEVFKEFYFATAHTVHAEFQWFGIHGHSGIAIYTWIALASNFFAFIIFVVPLLRNQIPMLSVGCVLAILGVFIEKGMGLLLPGMTPDTLGEIYLYNPSITELSVGVGVWGVGALVYTLMLKVVLAINEGSFRAPTSSAAAQ